MSSFFTVSKKIEDVKDSGRAYINASGNYPVTILAPVVSVGSGGSTSIDMFVNHSGQEQIVYGNLRITNNDGKPNAIGSKLFNQLLIIADLDDLADPVDMELSIGKKGADKSASVLEDLMGIEVIMQVRLEYGSYNGNITEKKNIRAFYRASDNASAEEIVNDKGFGTAFKKDEDYATNVTYKDGTDEEMIKAWIAAKRPKGTAGSSSSTAKAAPAFSKRRFGKSE